MTSQTRTSQKQAQETGQSNTESVHVGVPSKTRRTYRTLIGFLQNSNLIFAWVYLQMVLFQMITQEVGGMDGHGTLQHIDVLFPLVGGLIEGFVYPFNNR